MLILASQSPRRKELLSLTGIPFTTMPAETDEVFDPHLSVEENVAEIALRKATAAWNRLPEKRERRIVIGADTVVVKDGAVLGKPADYDDAVRMLQALQNSTHRVHTGFALLCASGAICECVSTTVEFEEMGEEQIRRYLDTVRPFDKAGSYGIQDPIMACHVKRIDGCYYNVVGLPVSRLCIALKRLIPGLP